MELIRGSVVGAMSQVMIPARVLERDVREGPSEERAAVRRELEWDRLRPVQGAYFHGREHDRRCAIRFLARYFLRHPGCLTALAYLIALVVPKWLVHAIAPVVRLLLPERVRDQGPRGAT